MEAMIEAAMSKPHETLIDAIRMIGGGQVNAEHRLARAAMIEAVCRNAGEAVADAIMDEIGL